METLKIKIPKGFEVDSFNKETGEIKFKETPKSVMERVKIIEDVLKENGLTLAEFKKSCEGLSEDEINYRLIKFISRALNEGWHPDWSNSDEYKYVPWFNMGSSASGFSYDDYDYWVTDSDAGSRLCFKSRELAEYAGKQFTDVYKKFMLIN